MNFSNTTDKNGIIQDIERYLRKGATGISGNAVLLSDITAFCNTELRMTWHHVFKSTNAWQYDDSNQTNLPSATANLVSGTRAYLLPSDALVVRQIKIKNSSGEYYEVYPCTNEEIDEDQPNGTPLRYVLVGNTIKFNVAPSYNSDAGLKVFFDRGSVSFDTSDTTQQPGFASEYHDLIPIGASIRYLKIYSPSDATIPQLEKDYARLLKNLEEFYQKQYRSYKPKLQRPARSWK